MTQLVAKIAVGCAIGVAVATIVAGCSNTDRPVYTSDEVRAPTPTTLLPVVVPATTLPLESTVPLVIERIWSPGAALAEVIGTGAFSSDPVTVDGVGAEFLSFELQSDGRFVARLAIPVEGGHSVCVRTECGRVFVLGSP